MFNLKAGKGTIRWKHLALGQLTPPPAPADVILLAEYLTWAVQSFLLSTALAKPETSIHTHMCYCDFEDCMDAIDRLDTDVNSIENGGSYAGKLCTPSAQSTNSLDTHAGKYLA